MHERVEALVIEMEEMNAMKISLETQTEEQHADKYAWKHKECTQCDAQEWESKQDAHDAECACR